MTSTIVFDLNEAKAAASTADTSALTLSAGRLGNAFDQMIEDLVANPTGSIASKAKFLDAVAEQISTSGMPALMGSHGSTSLGQVANTGSEDQIARLQNEINMLNTQNGTLREDRNILEAVTTKRGMATPTSINVPFDRNTANELDRRVREEITNAVDAAKVGLFTQADLDTKIAEAKAEAGLVSKADYDAKVAELEAKAAELNSLKEDIGRTLIFLKGRVAVLGDNRRDTAKIKGELETNFSDMEKKVKIG